MSCVENSPPQTTGSLASSNVAYIASFHAVVGNSFVPIGGIPHANPLQHHRGYGVPSLGHPMCI